MNAVAIITARGGSKRIPRKNVKPFHGKPILRYPLEAALKSGAFSEVMVSTDDDEIERVALAAGAKVPFRRSAKNSDDHSTTADVITEVLEAYAAQGKKFDYFCCLYPTAPLLTADRLKEAMDLLASGRADTVVPVTRFGFPIQRAFKLEGEFVKMFQPEHRNTRSQDLPAAYHDAGQFYCGRVDAFLRTRLLFGDRTLPIILPETQVQDIDNEEDWRLAELKYQLMQEKGRA